MKLVTSWINSPTVEELETRRQLLLSKLFHGERFYLIDQYQALEPHFVHAYTHQYRNLGVNSMQRNEGYRVITKEQLSQHLTVMKSVEIIAEEVLLQEKHI